MPAGRRPALRHWKGWAAPLTAAAAAIALVVGLVLVQASPGGTTHPASTSSASPTHSAAPAVLGRVPRYYAALTNGGGGLLVGDSVAGQVLETISPPQHKSLTTFFETVTAAADDRTFVAMAVTYATASIKDPDGIASATGTISWYELRLTPGAAPPVSLTLLPIAPLTVHNSSQLTGTATALSASGQQLAVTGFDDSNGLEVLVYSVATGIMHHGWASNEPPFTLISHSGEGRLAAGRISLTWIDGDRRLAVQTGTNGNNPADTIRELDVSGPPSGDLATDGKVVWDTETGPGPVDLLQACTEGHPVPLISAGGAALGCAALTGPAANPTLSFVTYPLGVVLGPKATVQYQLGRTGKSLSTLQLIWVSPSGDSVIGAWTTYAKGTLTDAANGLHVGVMSHGKFTPLRFPAGFDQQALVATVTW